MSALQAARLQAETSNKRQERLQKSAQRALRLLFATEEENQERLGERVSVKKEVSLLASLTTSHEVHHMQVAHRYVRM